MSVWTAKVDLGVDVPEAMTQWLMGQHFTEVRLIRESVAYDSSVGETYIAYSVYLDRKLEGKRPMYWVLLNKEDLTNKDRKVNLRVKFCALWDGKLLVRPFEVPRSVGMVYGPIQMATATCHQLMLQKVLREKRRVD